MERTHVVTTLMSGLAAISLAGALAQLTASSSLADQPSPGCCTYGSDCQLYSNAPWCRTLSPLGKDDTSCNETQKAYCCQNQTGSCMS
jgi:hypothetical protein